MTSRFEALVFGDHEDPRASLAELFGGEIPSSGQPPQPALDWALGLLSGPGAENVRSEMETIHFLRAAEPRLALKPATFLAHHALQAR